MGFGPGATTPRRAPSQREWLKGALSGALQGQGVPDLRVRFCVLGTGSLFWEWFTVPIGWQQRVPVAAGQSRLSCILQSESLISAHVESLSKTRNLKQISSSSFFMRATVNIEDSRAILRVDIGFHIMGIVLSLQRGPQLGREQQLRSQKRSRLW